jgi:hypothetical protein
VNTVRPAAVACALLLLTGCAGAYSDAAQHLDSPENPAAATSPGAPARNLDRKPLGNGLTITISPPKPFTPTDNAYPETPRAVAFEMTIDNEGATAYRPSRLAVTATCDGATIEQVIDSTQGYAGVVGGTDDVVPGQTMRFAVAFALPNRQVVVRVAVQPDTARDSSVLVFEGAV